MESCNTWYVNMLHRDSSTLVYRLRPLQSTVIPITIRE